MDRYHVEDPGEDGGILKWILKKWRQSVDLIQVVQHRVHRWAVLMKFLHCGELYDPLSDYQILWKFSARKCPFVSGGENSCKKCGHDHSFSVKNMYDQKYMWCSRKH